MIRKNSLMHKTVTDIFMNEYVLFHFENRAQNRLSEFSRILLWLTRPNNVLENFTCSDLFAFCFFICTGFPDPWCDSSSMCVLEPIRIYFLCSVLVSPEPTICIGIGNLLRLLVLMVNISYILIYPSPERYSSMPFSIIIVIS